MSLPFVPPPQRLAPDDVLAVEIIGDADTGFQDAADHLGIEHYVRPSGTMTGLHRVGILPIAAAILTAPADWTTASREGALEPVPGMTRGWWDNGPTWRRLGARYGFSFRTNRSWTSAEVYVRGTTGVNAFGWYRLRDADDPNVGYLLPPTEIGPLIHPLQVLEGVTHVLVLVYGDA